MLRLLSFLVDVKAKITMVAIAVVYYKDLSGKVGFKEVVT